MEEGISYRKIIHIDMDAFYASVEQMDNPELKGKPIAVGGGGQRGVVAAASYEARKFGVRSAMSGALALKKCPDITFVKPRFERYKEISNQIREIFFEYTDLVEPLALDEAFLDVTENINNHQSATEIATEIREKIFLETGLTASAGISINKFVAKIASDMNKPDGQKTIKPHEIEPFLEKLPIHKFFGIGKSTAEKMHSWGIFNGKNLKDHSKSFLEQHFGKSGSHYYNIVRGIHNSPVRPHRERKSLGAERTFSNNVIGDERAFEEFEKISQVVNKRLSSANLKGRTLTVKIKFSDFTQITRSKTFDEPITNPEDILSTAKELWLEAEVKKSVRLLGISLSNFGEKKTEDSPTEQQLKLTF